MQSRNPLGFIPNPRNAHSRSNYQSNEIAPKPFSSYQPNKSGIIFENGKISKLNDYKPTANQNGTIFENRDDEQPSDFSHFLKPTANQNGRRPLNGNGNNNGPKNGKGNDRCGPMWITTKNVSEMDDISMFVQQCNSMTVPFRRETAMNQENQVNSNPNNSSGARSVGANDHRSTSDLNPPVSFGTKTSVNEMGSNNNTITTNTNKGRHSNKHRRLNEVVLDYMPFDYSLKHKLNIIVHQSSFKWCQNIPHSIKSAAIQNMPMQNICTTELQRKQYKFCSALRYFQYPCTSNQLTDMELHFVQQFFLQNSKKLGYLQKMKDFANDYAMNDSNSRASNHKNNSLNKKISSSAIYNQFVDNLHEWIEAFHSAFYLFLNYDTNSDSDSDSPYMYINFQPFFHILFYYHPHTKQISVAISNTYQSFRNKLDKYGIQYRTPLLMSFAEKQARAQKKTKLTQTKKKKKKKKTLPNFDFTAIMEDTHMGEQQNGNGNDNDHDINLNHDNNHEYDSNEDNHHGDGGGGDDGVVDHEQSESDSDSELELTLEDYERNGMNISLLKKQRNKNGLATTSNMLNNASADQQQQQSRTNSMSIVKNRSTGAKHFHLLSKSITVTVIDANRCEIQKFFNFFINYVPIICLSIKKCFNLPFIFGNRIFLYSQLRNIKIAKNVSGFDDQKQLIANLELKGNILPHNFYQICQLFLFENEMDDDHSNNNHRQKKTKKKKRHRNNTPHAMNNTNIKCSLNEMSYGFNEAINHERNLYPLPANITKEYESGKKFIGIARMQTKKEQQILIKLK